MSNENPDESPNVEVDVTVTPAPEAAPEESSDSPDVVVVATGDAASGSDDTDRWVELERWKVETEQSIRAAAEEAYRAQTEALEARYRAEEAESAAEFESEEIAELAADVEETTELVEDTIAPDSTKVHPLFRPLRDWFPKRES